MPLNLNSFIHLNSPTDPQHCLDQNPVRQSQMKQSQIIDSWVDTLPKNKGGKKKEPKTREIMEQFHSYTVKITLMYLSHKEIFLM